MGLLVQPSDELSSDVDWASSVDDQKSIIAYCVFLGNTLVSWSSKKQTVVAQSSTKFEYRALAHAFAEVMWLKQLLLELGVPSRSILIIWCDNLSAGALATNPVFHERSSWCSSSPLCTLC